MTLYIKACPLGYFGNNCSVQCPGRSFGLFCGETCNCSKSECNPALGCGKLFEKYFIVYARCNISLVFCIKWMFIISLKL